MVARPLHEVVVVAVEQAVAAPLATRHLADLGARVIKVERPGAGDFARDYDSVAGETSSAFLWLNRGKESIALDLKSQEGRETLERLLDRADVFVQNMSPQAALRAGLDPASVMARHPDVIAGGVNGYGTSGPRAAAKAYDMLVQGETGMMSLSGDGDQMARVGVSIADISAGSHLCSGILAALLHRDRTGQALPVEVALFDSLTEWLAYPLYYTRYGGQAPPRTGTSHATIAPYGAFPTGDGRQVVLAVQNDREWRRFCEQVLDRPDLVEDENYTSHAARAARRQEIEALIVERFAGLTQEQALDLLDRADLAGARLNTIADLVEHPQLTSRGRWVPTPVPGGETRESVLPAWLPTAVDGLPPDLGAVPAVGEHTDQILAWLDAPASAAHPTTPQEAGL